MYTVEFNSAAITAGLTRLADGMDDMTPVMQELTEFLTTSTKDRFDVGVAPDGTPWAPKSQTTLDAYAARNKPIDPRPLRGPTGDLKRQIFSVFTPTTAEIGSSLIYSAVMQFGNATGNGNAAELANKICGIISDPSTARIVIDDAICQGHIDSANHAQWTLAEWRSRGLGGALLQGADSQISNSYAEGVRFGFAAAGIGGLLHRLRVFGASGDAFRTVGDNVTASDLLATDLVYMADGNHPDGLQGFGDVAKKTAAQKPYGDERRADRMDGARRQSAALELGARPVGHYAGHWSSLDSQRRHRPV